MFISSLNHKMMGTP